MGLYSIGQIAEAALSTYDPTGRSGLSRALEVHEALHQEIHDARAESNEKHDLTAVQIKALVKKIDDEIGKLNKKIDDDAGKQSQKIDAIIGDLAEHRADTEKHRSDYKVSE